MKESQPITLLDYFAGQALSSMNEHFTPEQAAINSYARAREMLKQKQMQSIGMQLSLIYTDRSLELIKEIASDAKRSARESMSAFAHIDARSQEYADRAERCEIIIKAIDNHLTPEK